MQTSPCKDGSDALSYHKGAKGFSLIEVIVTLAIISIVVSMVSVSLANSLQIAKFSALSRAAADEVRVIRARALLDRQNVMIVTDNSPIPDTVMAKIMHLPLPQDWRTEGEAIEITAMGMCLGGKVRMISPQGRQITYAFQPPACIPERVTS